MRNKTIIIVGGEKGIGTEISKELARQNFDVIVLNEPDDSFEVNGVRYTPIKSEKPKYNNVLVKYTPLLVAHSFMTGGYYERKINEAIDIIKEYGLFQLKQSKLSKWEREQVVKIFEKNFEKVK